MGAAGRILALQSHESMLTSLSASLSPSPSPSPSAYANPSDIVIPPSHIMHNHQPDHGLHDPHMHHSHHQPQMHHHSQSHHTHHHNPMLQDQPDHESPVYQPIDPQIINHHHPPSQHDLTFEHYHPHADFQALLSATEDVPYKQENDVGTSVDRDLEMLIEHDDVDDDVDPGDVDDVMVDGLTDGSHRDRGECIEIEACTTLGLVIQGVNGS
ncbi:hypothetical protein PT974_04125 [Cladobotryum mycophilum]|uniref:Uncharacterized protein n=1 Tax=Cladobotryum mycophilum TaxID=491253 RepID=A0ABR0SU70_9HYPO